MLNVAMNYHIIIDDITTNKFLKLWQYELNDKGWEIIGDLFYVLKVRLIYLSQTYTNIVLDV